MEHPARPYVGLAWIHGRRKVIWLLHQSPSELKTIRTTSAKRRRSGGTNSCSGQSPKNFTMFVNVTFTVLNIQPSRRSAGITSELPPLECIKSVSHSGIGRKKRPPQKLSDFLNLRSQKQRKKHAKGIVNRVYFG